MWFPLMTGQFKHDSDDFTGILKSRSAQNRFVERLEKTLYEDVEILKKSLDLYHKIIQGYLTFSNCHK